MGALAQLTHAQGTQAWARQVLAAAEALLGEAVGMTGTQGSQPAMLSNDHTATALFSIGEVRMLAFSCTCCMAGAAASLSSHMSQR